MVRRKRKIDLGVWTDPNSFTEFSSSIHDTQHLGCHYSRAIVSYLPRIHNQLDYKLNTHIMKTFLKCIIKFFKGGKIYFGTGFQRCQSIMVGRGEHGRKEQFTSW
jgi:hypothetical protein